MQNGNYRPLVLIVDDAPINVQVLAEPLRSDYRVKVATSGEAALEIVARQGGKPDLILLDVMMTGMDGYEVCRRLKADPATQAIPVIFVTARSSVHSEEHGLRLGAVDYIVKPFNAAIVKARVRNHVELRLNAAMLHEREAQLQRTVQQLEEARAQAELARAEAERANSAKSHFLAAASHDLRQPLHALDIYVRRRRGRACGQRRRRRENEAVLGQPVDAAQRLARPQQARRRRDQAARDELCAGRIARTDRHHP